MASQDSVSGEEPEQSGDPNPSSRILRAELPADGPTPDLPWIEAHLARAAVFLGVDVGEVSGVIVADDQMSELHEAYSGIAGTTDVLTFDLGDGPEASESKLEGEIVACRDEAARRAAEFEHGLERELLLYFVHGLLHLMGYDDQEPDDYDRMHRKEDEVLEAIGVGPVFKAGAGGAE